MSALVISNITIRQDAEGGYCLNDLHKAAGGLLKDQPSNWLNTQKSQDLIDEVLTHGLSGVKTSEGRYGGTYACKELVYAYAMWISPKFHLQVIRAYDAAVNHPTAHAIPQTLPEALRLAATALEERNAALQQIEQNRPKVKFAEVVTESGNTRCIRVWVKSMKHENNLIVGERAVFKWLLDNRYIFKDGSGYLPYARYEASGLNYFTVVIDEINGKPRRMLKITGKGVVALTGKVVAYFSGDNKEVLSA